MAPQIRPRIQRVLLRFPRAYALQEALRQADWRISVLTFLLLSAVVGGATFALGLALTHGTSSAPTGKRESAA